MEYGTLLSWQEYIEKALNSLEGIKTSNPDRYETLYKRVVTESVSVQYMIIKLYSSYYTASQLQALKDKFYADCVLANIRSFGEHRDISNAF